MTKNRSEMNKKQTKPQKTKGADKKLHYQVYIQEDYQHHPKEEEEMEY
ncbi:hypothetical protein [Alteribacter lacisalsi]|nr:hypothetical protein [Alteribacter lacisalsi]